MTAMGDVLPYRPPRAREEATAYIGMVVFLGSWAMLFASLFFAYGFVRARAGVWPPPGLPTLPKLIPAANTLVLAISSGLLHFGMTSLRWGSARKLPWAILGAFFAGTLFLTVQTWLWLTLNARGLTPSAGGPYSSVFYGLTWLHALHVLVGLFGLASVGRRAFAGEFSAARHLPVRLWSMYWHFVGIVWAVMFVALFLI